MTEIRKITIIPDRTLRGNETPEVKQAYRDALLFLDLYNLCDANRCLPRPGGLLDQDSLYVFLMRWTLQKREEKRIFDEAKREMKPSAVQLS